MNGTLKIDTSRFALALRGYKVATQKDEAYTLNRAARNVAYRAASFTRGTTAGKIRSDLMRDPHLMYALTAIALKKRGIGALRKPEFAKAVARFVSRRASSAKYLRAGWARAIESMGGNFRGAKFRGAGGFANKATISRLVAEIVNIVSQPNAAHAAGAELIGSQALQEAFSFVAEDMIDYARQKMAVTARQFSG